MRSCRLVRGTSLLLPRHFSGLLPQAAALVARYLLGKGQLDKDTLDTLANIRPTYLCILSPEQLDSVPPRVLW
jgi:hypothetical protein